MKQFGSELLRRKFDGQPPRAASFRRHVHADDFAGLAFRANLERAAANLAIRGETLLGQGGIHRHIERLAAERTLNFGEFFHAGNVTAFGQSAMVQTERGSASRSTAYFRTS